MTTLGPLRYNVKIFAAIAVLEVRLVFQVKKLDKYNNLLFNLLFPFQNVFSRSKSILRYDKLHGVAIFIKFRWLILLN